MAFLDEVGLAELWAIIGEKYVDAEELNRSSIANVTSEYGVSQVITANIDYMSKDLSSSYTLVNTFDFSISGTVGYSRRLKIAWSNGPSADTLSNANAIQAYFEVEMVDGTKYTSPEFTFFQMNDSGRKQELDITQIEKNVLSGKLHIYVKGPGSAVNATDGYSLGNLTLSADVVACIV